jgi:hypothetical protein
MGTILYVYVPIPASDSHDRHNRHATVIAVGSSLLLLPLPGLSKSAGWLIADLVPVPLQFSLIALRLLRITYRDAES